jgi:polysaccharide biosynthesis protein PslG
MASSLPRSGLVRALWLLVAAAQLSILLALSAPATASAAFKPDAFGVSVGGDILSEPAATRNRELDEMVKLGVRWVRVDIAWSRIQAAGPSSFNWSAVDPTVEAITARGMKVLGIISYTPPWARPPGTNSTYGPDPDVYADFAGVAVEHYSAMGVDTYEIWNEPNIRYFWTPAPDPKTYTRMLILAYAKIKQADPDARVLSGGTATWSSDGTNISPVDFLSAIYANGGAGSFDAVANHPYCYPDVYPGDAVDWCGWYQMYGTSPSLRSLMVAHGDGAKKIWGTEFGAPSNGPDSVTESVQAQMISRAYSLWQTYDWAGPLFTYELRDNGTNSGDREDWFGLLSYDWTPKPAYDAYKAAASGVASSGGTDPGGGSGTSGSGGTGTPGSGSGGTGTTGSGGTTGTPSSGGGGGSTPTGGTTTTGGATLTSTKVKIKGKGRIRVVGRVRTQSAFRRHRVGSQRVRVGLLHNRSVRNTFWHLGSRRGAMSWLVHRRFR